MHRKVLIDWFAGSKGEILQEQEAFFLQRAITVSCKQTIVQLGALGWENKFIDCKLYEQFIVLDDEQDAWYESKMLRCNNTKLPLQSESVDMVILPHLLEFENDKHQVLREVERVLKSEGKLIILSFNPWNLYINYQYLLRRAKGTPWVPQLVSRTKIEDWLRLLNFEVELAAGFDFDAMRVNTGHAEWRKHALQVAAYGMKAIKRRYHLIPIGPEKKYQADMVMAKLIDMPIKQKEHNENS